VEQLQRRSSFVNKLEKSGWSGSNFNRNFDAGLSSTPEASMTYSNRQLELRLDLLFKDPRMILYLDADSGKSLGLVFRCEDHQAELLETVIRMQDRIAPDNLKDSTEELLAVCPSIFKISATGDKLIPIKSKGSA
jgi:hypothetical protein